MDDLGIIGPSPAEANNKTGFNGATQKDLIRKLTDMDVDDIGRAKEYYDKHFALISRSRRTGTKETIRVEKSPFNEYFFRKVERDFGRPRYIYVLRNPYANMMALHIRRKRRRGRKILGFLYYICALRKSYNNILRIYEELPNRTKIVSFDILLLHPEKAMRQVAGFLGIEFSLSLLDPTLFGTAWGGNTMYGMTFEGIDQSPLYNWKKKTNPLMYLVIKRTLLGVYLAVLRKTLSKEEIEQLHQFLKLEPPH